MARFAVEYRISATASDVIEADTLEEARKKARQAAADDGFDEDFDRIDDVVVKYIAELIPVIREGKQISTTYVLPTDTRL